MPAPREAPWKRRAPDLIFINDAELHERLPRDFAEDNHAVGIELRTGLFTSKEQFGQRHAPKSEKAVFCGPEQAVSQGPNGTRLPG